MKPKKRAKNQKIETHPPLFFVLYQALENIKRQTLITVFGYHIVCKHQPSCSYYTLKEIEKNGILIGLYKGIGRIIRCW